MVTEVVAPSAEAEDSVAAAAASAVEVTDTEVRVATDMEAPAAVAETTDMAVLVETDTEAHRETAVAATPTEVDLDDRAPGNRDSRIVEITSFAQISSTTKWTIPTQVWRLPTINQLALALSVA